MFYVASCWFGSLVLLVLSVPGTAHADAPAPVSGQSDVTRAADQLRLGRRARAARRWAEAEAAFEAALGSAVTRGNMTEGQRAEVVGELGLCELEQGEYRDAAEHLQRSLDAYMALAPEFRRRVEDALGKAKAQVGRISLAVSPPDAAVLLNGRPIGRAARTYTLFVDPGPVTIRARLEGHQDAVQMFDMGKGQKQLISLQLSPAPSPAARTPESAPRKAASPARPARPPPAELSSIGSKLRVTGAVLTGVTAAAGGTFLVWSGIVDADFHERSAALYSKGWGVGTCGVPGAPSTCAELQDMRARRELFRQIGTTSLVASGAIGAVTLASFVFSWTRPSGGGGVRVVPLTTGQTAMLMVDGEWR